MKQKLGMKANRAELFSRFGILLIFALVVLVASLVSNRFLSTDNILSVFTQCTVIGVLSCGMTMLIVSGNTDLSAGSGVALAGVVCALVINTSGSWVLAVLATVVVMLLTSALQGILISYCALVPFIVTLAGQLAFRGAAQVLSGGAPIIGVGAIAKISSGKLFGVSWLIIITILMVLFTWLIMNYTSFGRYIYATGGNSEAATAELFLWNKENLISEIDQFSGALNEMRNALVADDREKLEEMFRLSTQRRAAFDKKAP